MEKNKIFIGNVSFNTEIEKLIEVFSAYGEIVESYKPQGKGFAFIQFKTEEAAQNAIDGMNGKEVDGRPLIVNFARPKEDRPRRFNDRGSYDRRNSDRRDFDR